MKRISHPAISLTALAFASSVFAATPLDDATRLAAQGKHAEAEARYDQALRADPKSQQARIGRGYVRAWQQRYALAAEDFRAVLASQPRHLEAQTGLAYTLAWAGDHQQAETEFGRSLAIAPGNFDAAKGLAYNALWRKDFKAAASRFSALTQSHPKDAELFVALGNAHRATGNEIMARAAFEQALLIEPGRADARQALAQDTAKPTSNPAVPAGFVRSYAATAFYGNTDFGNGQSKSGLRFAQIAVQATPALRVWVLYDGGLGLDNNDLAQRNVDADAYYVGGLKTWGGNVATKLEIGTRDIGNGTNQSMLRAEQIVFLAGGWVPKVGLWAGKSSGVASEYTLQASLNIPVTNSFRIEPAVFRSENAADQRETRALLIGEYAFSNGATLGAGYADGSRSNAGGADSRKETLLMAAWPLTPAVQLRLQARRQSGAGLPDNDLVAGGLTVIF